MTNVFISYRRDDAAGHAGRLSDRLVARFGAERVFVDVDDIQPGQNFEQAIEQTLSRCDYLLAVIGPRWLESLHARATRPEDFVRHEIAVAMARGLTVIPVLVGGARMPEAGDLPTELAPFARCQAVEIRDNRFDEDAARIVAFLAGPTERIAVNVLGMRVSRRALVAATIALIVALVGAAWVTRSGPEPAPQTSVDGDWVAEMQQRAGQPPYAIRLTLTRTGDRLNGVVRYPTGEGPILDGRVTGNSLTFRTEHTPQFESQPAPIQFQAEMQGDAIRLTLTSSTSTATGWARRAAAAPARTLPGLAFGTWTLRNARDEEGKNWSNSVLQFTSQEESPEGLRLRGRFTWRLDNQLMGTEEFEGHYVERTRQVILEGSAVTDVPHQGSERLAVGSYSAVLAPDERSLLQGRWGSTAQNEPGFAGDWEAVR